MPPLRRALRLLPVAWLVVLLAIPAVAYVLGARQGNLQNRPAATFPSRSLHALTDPETFTQLDAALLDRLPLRGTALDVRGRLEVDALGDSPNPKVLLGEDRWLYFDEELDVCRAAGRPVSDPADAAELVARALVGSGRRAIVTVPGTKLSVHPQDAPDVEDQAALACLRRLDRRVGDRLARTPGGLDLRPALDALERRGTATFLRSDTHWSAAGRELFVREVLRRIRPGLDRQAGVRVGSERDRSGDLGVLMGLRRTDRDRPVEATRAPDRPVRPGSVALIGDSQMNLALVGSAFAGVAPIRDRVLPGQPVCDVNKLGDGACDTALRGASTVLVERVSRNLGSFTRACWRPVAVSLEGRTGPTGRWTRPDGTDATRRVPLAPAGSNVVARLPGGDVADVPRIVRMVVQRGPGPLTMTQRPTRGPAAPCATDGVLASGTAKLLPVPAGRSVSQLAVHLAAPEGTVLGPPQELVLDGRRLPRARATPRR